jgi:N-methylhydantoinase A
VFWPGHEKWIPTAVYDGPPALGVTIQGPALVQLPHTTIAVAPGQSLETDNYANCILHTQKQETRA